jgi:drug/metabolite transporter (DMT)-like permease
LFTPIFIYLLVKEKLTIYTFIGLIVSFGGVLLLVTKDYSGVTTLKGVALLFFAVFSAISYGIVVKKLSVNYSGFTIVKWQNTIGLFFFLPIFFIFEYSHFLSVKPSIGVILTILKLAIFASAMAFILKVHVIKKIGLINSNIFANLIPVFTAVIAYFILKEPLDLKRVLGILIVICGLFVSQIPQFLKEKS